MDGVERVWTVKSEEWKMEPTVVGWSVYTGDYGVENRKWRVQCFCRVFRPSFGA